MRKKVLFHSDFALAKTGFGRVMKTLLSHLYKTDKYDIYHYCCGMGENDIALKHTPWTSIGSLPADQQELSELARDPNAARAAGYGSYSIDKVIAEIKPDIYIGVQDWWGVDYVLNKGWFNNLTSALWITLDSLPILKPAKTEAHKIKNYWVWSNFAEKALKLEGENHVKTVHGPIDTKHFHKLPEPQRRELRKKFNLPEDSFIVGFVFRNQLRKLVPNVIEGYKMWKTQNPHIKNTYLLLHTNFSEGWNIKDQAELHGVDTKEIITTYICRKCKEYEVKTFDDRTSRYELDPIGKPILDEQGKRKEVNLEPQHKDCRFCGTEKAQVTTGVGFGITEQELNEVYNLMDVYLHALTSGGQEIPIQEAKLCELVTLVTNYSCGEEMCEPQAKSFPLDWSKYIEHGTEFIKASTLPSSICKQLTKFHKMSKPDRDRMGREAREWALENYSIDKIGVFFEQFLDNAPKLDSDNTKLFEGSLENPNPNAPVGKSDDDNEWVSSLYKEILDRTVKSDDEGHRYWISELKKGTDRGTIEKYFRMVAQKSLDEKNDKKNWIKILNEKIDDNGKNRMLYVIPKTLADCLASVSVLQALKRSYGTDWDIYVASEGSYKEVFDTLVGDTIKKWIEYVPEMDHQTAMEAKIDGKRLFNICYNPYFNTQRLSNYQHGGQDRISLCI